MTKPFSDSLLEAAEDWRKSYDIKLGGRLGFHHDKLFDPEKWYLPDFNTDEWGTWFGGWRAQKIDLGKRGTVYSLLGIDFDAVTVKKLILKNHGGFPDKYIGDAIVAIFGAPVQFENHAEHAVQCAIEMQRKIREINDQRRKEGNLFFENADRAELWQCGSYSNRL